MSTNGDTSKLKIVCPACNQNFSAEAPPLEIANNLRTSVVTAAHSTLTYCINSKCRQAFVLMIQGAQVAFNIQPVGPDVVAQIEGSPIIKAGPRLELI